MDRDISNWGWGQLLELPDHLFGRRHCVGCSVDGEMAGTYFAISLMPLPEKCVIWGLLATHSKTTLAYGRMSLALGDQMPPNDAAFNRLEQLFPDIGYLVGARRDITVTMAAQFALRRLKVGVDSQGRRLVMRVQMVASGEQRAESALTVSSVPRSIPEWFG